jgi:hypothetical protein
MKSVRTLSLLIAVVQMGLWFAPIAALTEESVASVEKSDCGPDQGECLNPDTATTTSQIVQEEEEEDDPNCPSRDSIIRCARKHLDTNDNGKLDRTELESSIATLPWYARGLLHILGSVDKMVRIDPPNCSSSLSLSLSLSLSSFQKNTYCFPSLNIHNLNISILTSPLLLHK